MYAQELCLLISRIYDNNWSLKFLLLVQFFFASFSLVCLISLGLLITIWRRFTIQLRLLLLSFLSSLVFADIGVLLSSVYQLQVLIFRADHTRCYWFSYTFNDCHVIRLLFNISVVAVYTSSTMFAIESLVSWTSKLKSSTSKYFVLFMISLQWMFSTFIGFSVNGFFDVNSPKTLHQPHCSVVIPTPTQFNGIFFILLCLHIFTLVVYTFSCIYINRKKAFKCLESVDKHLYENLISTEVTFPLICITVTLYVTCVVLDEHFLSMITSLLVSYKQEDKYTYTSKAFWYECQTAIIPLSSLLIFGFLIKKICPQKLVQHQQETFGRTHDGAAFDERSDILSFHSLEGTLKCTKEVKERCKEICSKLPYHPSPSISTFFSSDSSTSSPKLYDIEGGVKSQLSNKNSS